MFVPVIGNWTNYVFFNFSVEQLYVEFRNLM